MYGQITGQLGLLGSSKIDPIAIDACFGETLSYQNFPAVPFVILYSDELVHTVEFIRSVLRCPTLPEFGRDSLLVYGAEDNDCVVHGESLSRIIPADNEMKTRGIAVISSRSQMLQKISIFCCTTESLKSNQSLLQESCGVFGVLKPTGTELVPNNIQRFSENARLVHSKLRVVFLANSVDPSGLNRITRMIWALARSSRVPESPRFHFCCSDGFGLEDIEKDILSLPLRAVLQCVVAIGIDAKRVRCHAAIVSYLKTQLPVFNRESKQAELAANILQLLPTIANKFGIPLSDFNTLPIDQGRLAVIDFSKIKKIRDFASISEVINIDIPKLLSVIPHTDTDLMELGWTTQRGSQTQSLLPRSESANIAMYVDDFYSMNPTDGTLAGDEKVKSHLTSLAGPNVNSRTLHRIWRLSDKDADGRLSLREYALCRDLIEFANQGNDIPKNL